MYVYDFEALHIAIKRTNISSGFLLIPVPAGSCRFETVDILLPGRRDDLCHWQEWLWKNHAWSAVNAILSTYVRRDIN